jgi:MFS family permease
MIPLFLGLSLARSSSPGISPEIICMIAGSLFLFGLFIRTQMAATDPILAISLFKNRVYSISMIAVLLANALFFAPIIYLPLFIQNVLKMTATTTGMIITPMVLSLVIAAIITGQMISRSRRYKKLALFGFVTIGVSMMMLAMIQPDTPIEILIIASILLGSGSGIMHPLFSVAAQNAFTFREIGVITSSLQFSRNLGATIIPPVLGVIMYGGLSSSGATVDITTVPPEILTYAISLVFDSCLVLTALAFIVTYLLEDIAIKPRVAP